MPRPSTTAPALSESNGHTEATRRARLASAGRACGCAASALALRLDSLRGKVVPLTSSSPAAPACARSRPWRWPEDIARLARTLALLRGGKGHAPLEEHATTLWPADAQGLLRMRYAGNPPDAARIEQEMGALVDLSDRGRRPPFPPAFHNDITQTG